MHDKRKDGQVAIMGVVVIGRNEGERLARCLASVAGVAPRLVYVDSGSTDASVAMARARGADVVELDGFAPFTAARARNAGFARLRATAPRLEFVQFVDGDCELAPGWLARGARYLRKHPDVAAVAGRLRERHPEQSIYNLLSDIGWEEPAGDVRSCGGVAMLRADALARAAGYREDVIAGEEPELCVRLRGAGWRIVHLDDEMALHDASIVRFGQWWKRTLRTGYAFALGAALHGAAPERHGVRESRSAWFWGLGVPLAALALAPWAGAWALAVLLAYPIQIVRLALRAGRSPRENWLHATFLMLGKFPEMLGQAKFLLQRRLGGEARLIEYK